MEWPGAVVVVGVFCFALYFLLLYFIREGEPERGVKGREAPPPVSPTPTGSATPARRQRNR